MKNQCMRACLSREANPPRQSARRSNEEPVYASVAFGMSLMMYTPSAAVE